MSEALKRVGFIGLGSQGGPMARRIIEAGYPATLWARRPATLEPFADLAAGTAASPAELAAASDLVGLCVTGDQDVRAVMDGPHGVLAGLRPGSVVAIHSTVHPDTCRDLAEQASARRAALVDAPVSGGGLAASAGRLLVMVGGGEETFERVRPVFAAFGDPVVHLGPVGSGQVTKLLNNVLFAANLANAGSALALAGELGVDPGQLGGVIAHGSGASFALARLAGSGTTLDQVGSVAGPLLGKDLRLIQELASGVQGPPRVVLDTAEAALALMHAQ